LGSFLPAALVAIIGVLVFGLFITYMDRLADAIIGVKTDEFARLTSISRVVRRYPLLVLRAIDDEAALFLAVGTIGNRLSRRMARWMYVGSAVMIGGAFPLLLLFGFSWVTYLTVLSTIVLFQVAWLLVPGLFKAFYGKELVFGSYRCEISSHSVPNLDRETEIQPIQGAEPDTWGTVVTLHQTAEIPSGLRHGIYSHPQSAERKRVG
jgi:hypothetical protein